jgi:hypothetical protein
MTVMSGRKRNVMNAKYTETTNDSIYNDSYTFVASGMGLSKFEKAYICWTGCILQKTQCAFIKQISEHSIYN